MKINDEGRSVYLASPIDFRYGNEAFAVADWVIQDLIPAVPVFSPAKAWDISPTTPLSPAVQRANRAILSEAGVVVGVFTEQPSIGVPYEISEAVSHGIPVLLVVEEEVAKRSWVLAWLRDNPNCETIYFRVPPPDEEVPFTNRLDELPTVCEGMGDADIRAYLQDQRLSVHKFILGETRHWGMRDD